jgi:Protein of unknown function (DUF3037)
MKTPYIFSVLRYIYDPLTLEFVNVGVVVYSPETKSLQARCTQHYSRISKLFVSFDGLRLRQTLRFIQDQINDLGREMGMRLQFQAPSSMHEILNSVLPPDDSSLQFAKGGVGITEDLDSTIKTLFVRYVERYAVFQDTAARDDDDVWRSFRASFDRKNITPNLVPKRIVAKNYDYEFQRAWKNGSWHLYEPISFDLLDASSIKEKANRWVGRAMSLEDSRDPFKLFLLLGAPSDERLRRAYQEAENLLHKMPVPHEFVEESHSEEFAADVASEMAAHADKA